MALTFMKKETTIPSGGVAVQTKVQEASKKLNQVVEKIEKKIEAGTQPNVTDQKVNRYLELKEKLDSLNPKPIMNEMEILRKELLTVAMGPSCAPDQQVVFKTTKGTIVFSEVGEATNVVDPAELVEHVYTTYGKDALNSVIKFGITELKKVLSAVELAKFTKQLPTGRTLKAAMYESDT